MDPWCFIPSGLSIPQSAVKGSLKTLEGSQGGEDEGCDIGHTLGHAGCTVHRGSQMLVPVQCRSRSPGK